MAKLTPEQDVLVGFYKAAGERLRTIVLNPTGKTDKSKEFKSGDAAARINQIQRELRTIDQQAARWVGREIPRAALAGREKALAQLSGIGFDASVVAPAPIINSKAVQIVAADTAADLRKAVAGMEQTAARVLRKTAQLSLTEKQINEVVAGNLIEGKPAAAIRELRDMFKAIGDGKTVPVTGKDGQVRNYDAGYYAELVIRTKTREAVTAAQIETFKDQDIDLVVIDGAFSGNFCTAYLGKVFSISGQSKKYPALSSLPSGGPPFHPNCTKSVSPFIEELASDAEKKVGAGVADTDKLLGVNATEAQRRFKDLQLGEQVKGLFKEFN